MKEINNLIYTLELNYINSSGINTSISLKLQDDGLERKAIKIGEVCITEETICGRILGRRLDDSKGYCGYKYDYQNGEDLININPKIDIDAAITMINKANDVTFWTEKLVLSSILGNDYRVVKLDEGNLNIIKTISAKNEKLENCSFQEDIVLSKSGKDEIFVEQSKKRVYKIDDRCVIEENQIAVDSDIKLQLSKLVDIVDKNPRNYKELINLKDNFQSAGSRPSFCNATNEEDCYE